MSTPAMSMQEAPPGGTARLSTDTYASRGRRLSWGRRYDDPYYGGHHHRFHRPHIRKHFGKPKMSGFKNHFMAGFGEFIGTTMFLFLAEGGAKTAQLSVSSATESTNGPTQLNNQTIMFIALSFGMSLLVTA